MDNQEFTFPTQESVPREDYPIRKRGLVLLLLMLPVALFLCNGVIFGGYNLGFALGCCVYILLSGGYLLRSGCKPALYPLTLLFLGLVIAAGYARTDDGAVKFLVFGPLVLSISLGLCLLAGQNRRPADRLRSIWDAPRSVFVFGLGNLPESVRSAFGLVTKDNSAAKKGGAFLLGLCIALPFLLVMASLLMSADAAFEGLLNKLPQPDLEELLPTAFFGIILFLLMYSQAVSLCYAPKDEPVATGSRKGLEPITVNTMLGAACVLYLVYLGSQLAYFVGGFSGILPENYSTAEYARRGFFEMCMLCVVNLTLMTLALRSVRKTGAAPLPTRLLCLGIGLMSLFFVATASAKMFFYIGTYGLTRQRVLTQIIMLFMGITTVTVLVWLFLPKLPYMKVVLLSGLMLAALTIWVDVDTLVARYNVDAFLSGKLETVDVDYLKWSSYGALPHLERLKSQAPDTKEARAASIPSSRLPDAPQFREWNYTRAVAARMKDTP